MRLHPAVKVAVTALVTMIVIGLLMGLMAGQLFNQGNFAWSITQRIALVGVGLALASGLARYFQVPSRDGKGKGDDWPSLGAVLGLALAGFITQSGLTSSLTSRETQPGEVLEIAGPTLEGKQFSLDQNRGKVTLVDFWATWCGPCVAELPNVKEAYQLFHEAGLEIVGVSFDDDRAALEQFVAQEQMPWPQIIFPDESQRGFANPNGVRYQVDSIPCMMLVDQQGRLIARDLRGHEVQTEIRRALGLPGTWSQWLMQRGWDLFNWLALGIMAARWFVLLPAMVLATLALCWLQRVTRRTTSQAVPAKSIND